MTSCRSGRRLRDPVSGSRPTQAAVRRDVGGAPRRHRRAGSGALVGRGPARRRGDHRRRGDPAGRGRRAWSRSRPRWGSAPGPRCSCCPTAWTSSTGCPGCRRGGRCGSRRGGPAGSPSHPRPVAGGRGLRRRRAAAIADSCGPAKIDRLVDARPARFDPVEQAETEDEAQGRVGCAARRLHRAGLGRDLAAGDHRRHPDPAPGSTTCSAGAHDQLDPSSRPTSSRAWTTARSPPLGSLICGATTGVPTKTYVHLDFADLPRTRSALGTVERLGPLTVATIKEWLGTAGSPSSRCSA